jgi:hypothetical protein
MIFPILIVLNVISIVIFNILCAFTLSIMVFDEINAPVFVKRISLIPGVGIVMAIGMLTFIIFWMLKEGIKEIWD